MTPSSSSLLGLLRSILEKTRGSVCIIANAEISYNRVVMQQKVWFPVSGNGAWYTRGYNYYNLDRWNFVIQP